MVKRSVMLKYETFIYYYSIIICISAEITKMLFIDNALCFTRMK